MTVPAMTTPDVDGVAGRDVLLDIPPVRGVDALEPVNPVAVL